MASKCSMDALCTQFSLQCVFLPNCSPPSFGNGQMSLFTGHGLLAVRSTHSNWPRDNEEKGTGRKIPSPTLNPTIDSRPQRQFTHAQCTCCCQPKAFSCHSAVENGIFSSKCGQLNVRFPSCPTCIFSATYSLAASRPAFIPPEWLWPASNTHTFWPSRVLSKRLACFPSFCCFCAVVWMCLSVLFSKFKNNFFRTKKPSAIPFT